GPDVAPEHPESWPEPLPARNLDARFNPAIGPRPFILREQARGRVLLTVEILQLRFDDKFAAFEADVVGARSVILEFVVSPTATAAIVTPLFKIRHAAVRLVEF